MDIYWDTPLGRFVKALFERLVVTSTQVELVFSFLTKLTNTENKRLGLAGLAAKATNHEFSEIVDRWRARVLPGRARASFKTRPVWAKGKVNYTGLHHYAAELKSKMALSGELGAAPVGPERLATVMRKASSAWDCEPSATKAHQYEAAAKKVAQTRKPDSIDIDERVLDLGPGAPLGLASLDGEFPIQPELVEKYQDEHNFKATVDHFKQNYKSGFYTSPLCGFPEEVEEETTCRGTGCCKELFEAFVDKQGRPQKRMAKTAGELLEYIRLVLAHAKASHHGPAKVSDPTIF